LSDSTSFPFIHFIKVVTIIPPIKYNLTTKRKFIFWFGGKLKATVLNGKVVLTDEKGGKATVTATNPVATHRVIHVIDKVLLPDD